MTWVSMSVLISKLSYDFTLVIVRLLFVNSAHSLCKEDLSRATSQDQVLPLNVTKTKNLLYGKIFICFNDLF